MPPKQFQLKDLHREIRINNARTVAAIILVLGLLGVILSLLLVGINSSSTTHIVALEPGAAGGWRRGSVPSALPAGQVTAPGDNFARFNRALPV
mgnify:CR=1 FL=1